jgi:hypothetical protein
MVTNATGYARAYHSEWYGSKTWHGAHEVDTQHATAAQGAVGHGVGHVVVHEQLQHVEVLQLVH